MSLLAAAVPLALADWVRQAMDTGGYGALGGLIVLENLFPPIPSELILPLAGFYVGQGVLGFVPALIIATATSVVGALLLYAFGRYGGRPLLLRFGRVLRLTEERLDRADDWFDEHGPKIVFFGRLVPGVRSIVSIPAGTSEMPLARFVSLTAAGSAVWNAALIGAGWGLGSNWERVGDWVGAASRIVLIVVVVAIAGGLVYLWRRSRTATSSS